MPAHTGAIFRAASCSMCGFLEPICRWVRATSVRFGRVRSGHADHVGWRTGTAGLERFGWRTGAAADCRKRAGATTVGARDSDRNRLDGLLEPVAALRAARSVPRSHGVATRSGIGKRLIRDVADREDPVAELANAALAQIVGFLGAAQGRLVTGVGAADTTEGAERTRTMAEAAVNGQPGRPRRWSRASR